LELFQEDHVQKPPKYVFEFRLRLYVQLDTKQRRSTQPISRLITEKKLNLTQQKQTFIWNTQYYNTK